MKWIGVGMLGWVGCAHPLTGPTLLANSARASLDVAAPILRTECVDERDRENRECKLAIEKAKGAEAIEASRQCDSVRAERDRFCGPAVISYRKVRLAHAALVAAIAVAQESGESGEVIKRAAVLAEAVTELGRKLEGMK